MLKDFKHHQGKLSSALQNHNAEASLVTIKGQNEPVYVLVYSETPTSTEFHRIVGHPGESLVDFIRRLGWFEDNVS